MKAILKTVSPKQRILWLEDLWKACDIPSAWRWGTELQTAAGRQTRVRSLTQKFLPSCAFLRRSINETVLFVSSVPPISFHSPPGKGLMIERKCSFLVLLKLKLCAVVKLAPEKCWELVEAPAFHQPRAKAKNQHAARIRIDHIKTCTWMFIAALFITAKRWLTVYQLMNDEWINKMCCIHTVEYFWQLKENTDYTITLMNFKNIILS